MANVTPKPKRPGGPRMAMTDRGFDYGDAEPYLETASVALESHGFTFEGGCASGAERGEYRFKMPNRRASISVQAPVTPSGNKRILGRIWCWRPTTESARWQNAPTVETMIIDILMRIDEFS